MEKVLPKDSKWIKDRVDKFKPESNIVVVANGDTIQYEYLIIALGLQLNWNKVLRYFIQYYMSFYPKQNIYLIEIF